MKLSILLEVQNNLEAYQVISHLGFEHDVLEADYEGKKYKFSKVNEKKKTKAFLRDNFEF